MKKLLSCLAVLSIMVLASCGCKKPCRPVCEPQEVCYVEEQEPRCSGVLSDKEVGWTQEDYR
jgi:hypothetical protein